MEVQKNTNATIALVMGIVSIVLFFLSMINNILGIIFSMIGIGLGITAIVCGSKGRKISSYKGMATAGFVCGIIGVSLCPISLLGCFSDLQTTSLYNNQFNNIESLEKEENINNSYIDDSNEKFEDSSLTLSQSNALKRAKSYLKYSSFSRQGLIDQLEFEQYSNEDAVYAVDHVDVDWYEQAVKKAESYLKYSSFSRQGLIDQLEFEGFTSEQANYGVNSLVVDWNEQAVKKAESYLKYSSFSRQGLIDQLEYEGFTYEQAVYGVEKNGY